MTATSSDKVLIGTALVLTLASAVVFGMRTWRDASAPPEPVTRVQLSIAPYIPAAVDAAAVKTDTWTPPIAQSRGRDWIYDTFTPPEIFYSARSRQFTVRPPTGLSEDEPSEAFGLELVSVRPEPFRLQLIGYVGSDGNWRGTFENVRSGEVFLAAAGRRVPSLALSIKNLDVRPQPVEVARSMTTRQRVATAVVRDEITGRDVTLTHRERQFTGTLFAFVAAAGQSATREVRAGDTFTLGDATYRIDAIQNSPPALEVTKESPNLTLPDVRTLTPRESDASEDHEPPATYQQ
ncbi:MAG: hypothetical protein HY736_03260 [Verrucomicrobia bacterium]|nr:hypothetical protein [Verrucomicrobiota bacterium]